MRVTDRYASAVHSSNLASEPDTTQSDSDVLGAAGLAAKRRPLALALLRLFSGDNHSREVVAMLAEMLVSNAWMQHQQIIPYVQAQDIARMVLAWHRDGVCKPCGGHGYELVEGAPSLSGTACKHCRGTRRVPFEAQFPAWQREHALWLRERIEREQGVAGAAAMKALAPRLEM